MALEDGVVFSAPGSVSRISATAYSRLTAAVFLGAVARLALSWKIPAQPNDADVFSSWAQTLRDHPLKDFYATARRPDHLPGDLWFLKIVQVGFSASGHDDFRSHAFDFLLKTVPTVADVVIGILVFSLVRTWASEKTAVRAAQWYLFNPAVIMLTAVWGQWDAVSAAIVLTGLLLVVRGGERWIWCAPFLVWGLLVKPTLLIVDVMVVLWLVGLVRPWQARAHRSRAHHWAVLTSVAMGVATAVMILAPFRVGVAWTPSGGSSLAARVRYAADLYPFTTMGAPNLWLLVDKRLFGRPDDVARWGAVTPAEVATVLFVLVMAVTVLLGWRTFRAALRPEALLWSGAVATFGSCLVLTRAHERYYFPAVLLLLLWASTRELDVVRSTFYWVFSMLFLVDLVLAIDWMARADGFAHITALLIVVATLHVVIFLGLLVTQWWTVRAEAFKAGAPSGVTAARRTAPG